MMGSGLALVRAHFASFAMGRSEDYAHQIAPYFRYSSAPAILGQGPIHVQRWREMLFSIYQTWTWDIEDAFEQGNDVIVRMVAHAENPVDPANTPPEYEHYSLCRFEIVDGLLASSSGYYAAADEHKEHDEAS